MKQITVTPMISPAVASAIRQEAHPLEERNPKAFHPWRTEIRSHLWMDTIRKRIDLMKLPIASLRPDRIVLKGNLEGLMIQELMMIGLTEEENYRIRSWQNQ